jgi:uncharacterized protein involved in exopolysaccharide biosynthesis
MESPREINIMDYPRVIWRRAWLIALVTFLIAAATFTVSVLLKDVYEAEITFRIMSQQTGGTTAISQIPSSAQTALGLYAGDQELQTYAQILTSRHIIGKVIDALPYLMDKYHKGQSKGLFGRIKGIAKPYSEDIREQMGEEEFGRRILLKELRDSIRVRHLGGDVLSVKVRWGDPEEATDIAGRLGEELIKYDRLARQEAADRTLEFIQSAITGSTEREEFDYPEVGVEQALTEAERKLRDFKKQHKTVVMQEEAKQIIGKLVDAEDALSSAIIARKTAEARLADMQKQLAEQSQTIVSAKTVTDNPIVQYLQREMARLEIQAESLSANYGEANPELKDLETQLAEYEKRIRREVPRIVSQETTSTNPLYEFLRQEEINSLVNITVSKARESALRERIMALEEKLTQMPDEEMELTRLTREVETYNRIYLTLRQSESEAQLAKESIFTNISILDEPDIPLEPAAPRVMLNTAIGGVIGLMLGLGLAFFLEYITLIMR